MKKFILPVIILFSVFGFFVVLADSTYTPRPMCGFLDPGPCPRSDYIQQELSFYIPLAPLLGPMLLSYLFSNKNGGMGELAIKIIGLVLGYAAARVTYHYLKKDAKLGK